MMNKQTVIKFLACALALTLYSCQTATVSPRTCNTSMTDNNITTTVQVRIQAEKGLSDQLILVSTYERVVTLTGKVENPTQADVAYVLAKSTPNVKYVISKIKVKGLNNR